MSSRTLVELIPWDPMSATHNRRLVQQREQCGWNSHKVEGQWKDQQISGAQSLYWIILSDEDPESEEKLRAHFDMYKGEDEPLVDTAEKLGGGDVKPSQRKFHAVGHIALATENPGTDALDLELPEQGLYWIKTFYVSRALQSNGVGRAAMDMVEVMAVEPPLSARIIALDTMHKDDQIKSAKFSNQEWYAKRGYELIKTIPSWYVIEPNEDGTIPVKRTVFMRKIIIKD